MKSKFDVIQSELDYNQTIQFSTKTERGNIAVIEKGKNSCNFRRAGFDVIQTELDIYKYIYSLKIGKI